MPHNSNEPTIASIWAAYENDARYRNIASVTSIVSHSKRILEFFGALPFSEFCKGRNQRIRDYVTWRRSHMVHRRKGPRPTSDSTINREIRNLQTALNFAEREEIIEHAVKLQRPKANGPRRRVLSRAGADGGELKRLMAALNDKRTKPHTRLSVLIALYTGQRKGAIYALRWEHVDFDAGMIFFTRTLGTTGKVWADAETKKKRADKPMSETLRAILLEAKSRATCDAVVEWAGKPIENGRHAYQALLKRAGISEATFHDLRRTSATIVRHGLSLAAAAEHIADTLATTDKHYAQADARANLDAQNVIEQALGF